jgi:hypothetical protein
VKVWPVDSNQTMLSPQDILVVAANEYKEGLETLKEDARKLGMSPLRLSYTALVSEFSDPRLIRIRAGNTLFTIQALPERTGFVRGYNGDIAPNYINNMIELADSARKIGFDTLLAHGTTDVVRAIKLAARQKPEMSVRFDSSTREIVITTGPKRD